MKRRILSIVTALALCLSLCPTWAFAIEGEPDTGLCPHGELAAECYICPIEDLIAALPWAVTEDNRAEVEAQLQEILNLYRELTADEQEQLDLSRCWELQAELDTSNAPMLADVAANNVVINQSSSQTITFTENQCVGSCPGHIITQTISAAQTTTILVESGTHDITFSSLSLTNAKVGIMPGATMNLTIDGTNSISAGLGYAGIYVPVDATLVIMEQSTGSLNVSGSGPAAGIGGSMSAPNDTDEDTGNINCGTVIINGGTITATGGDMSAGIGGAGGDDNNHTGGNGGTVTINGGTIRATGGDDEGFYGGAGIGGGTYRNSGNGGTLTINGGHVTLDVGTHHEQWGVAYGFGQGRATSRPSGPCTLTLADESYLTLADGTTLDPNGTYTLNGDPTEDMIVVPEGLVYTGKAFDLDGQIYIDDSKAGTTTLFERTFSVKASADGWELQDLGEVVNAGPYTAVFKKDGKTISKTFTVAQSGTEFTGDGVAKAYMAGTPTTIFSVDDPMITVIATPTATGQAPSNAAMAASLTEPVGGQMALFVGDTQVSAPVSADADGSYTMDAYTQDVLAAAGEPGKVNLTAQFVGTASQTGAKTTVEVTITAVAKVETDSATAYYGSIETAWSFAQNNAPVTVTLLADAEAAQMLTTKDATPIILDAGAYTLTLSSPTLSFGGSVRLRGGMFQSSDSITLSGKTVINLLDNSDGTYRAFYKGGQSVCLTDGQTALPAGTYTVDVCDHTAEGVCEYQPNDGTGTHQKTCLACGYTETANCTYGAEYGHDETNHWQTCTVCNGTSEKAAHTFKYIFNSGTYERVCEVCGYQSATGTYEITQDQTLVYGDTAGKVLQITTTPEIIFTDAAWYKNDEKAGEGTSYTLLALSAGTYTYKFISQEFESGAITIKVDPSPLTAAMVTLADGPYTYTSKAQTPAVTIGGLTENTDYTVAYSDNINVGTATVAVTGQGNYTGTATKTFTIAKATPIVTAPAAAIEYGQTLADSTLTGGSAVNPISGATVAGKWLWTEGTTQPTETGEHSATFTPTDTANYNAPDSVKVTVTVSPAKPKLTLTVPAYQVAGKEVTVSCSVKNPYTDTLTDAPTPTITCTLPDGTAFPLTDGKFTIPSNTDVGTKITVTATTAAVEGKYQEATETATVEVTAKIPVEIGNVSADSRDYNGQPYQCTGTPTAGAYTGTFTFAYTGRNGTDYSSADAPTNAGEYTVTITLKDTTEYIAEPLVLNFSINQAPATVTATSKTITKGTAVPNYSYTITPSGANLGITPTLSCSYTVESDAGKYPITVTGAAVSADGNYTITYVDGELTVNELAPPTPSVTPVTGVTLDRNSLTLTIGESFRLTVTVTPSNATNKSVTWTSSNSGVASVSGGTVTAASVGTTSITVTTQSGGHTATCIVTVKAKQYEITYNANGGTGTMSSGTAPDQEPFALPGCSFTAPEGKVFDAWAIGSVNGPKVQPGGSYTFTGDTTVYAVWKDLPYNITGIVLQNGVGVPGATVQLKQGAEVIAQQITGAGGSFTFSDIPTGVYNLVAEKDGITMTVMQEIVSSSASLTITLPAGKTNSVVDIEGTDTPPVIVGELDTIFQDETVYTPEDKAIVAAGGAVEFKLAVKKQENPPAAVQIEAIKPAGQIIGLFLDLTITKTVTPQRGTPTSTTVDEVGSLIETIVPLPAEMQGKGSYTVYREHDGKAEALPSSDRGERYEVNRDKTAITIFAQKYSTYAIAWSDSSTTPVVPDTPTPSRPTGGGGGSSVSSYAVTINRATHGKVTSNRTKATSGSTVTLTVTPDSGYVLDALTVTDSRGTEIKLTSQGSDKYTFTMPARSVTVTAVFVSTQTPWSNPYSDMRTGAWYYDAVQFVTEDGLMSGYGNGLFGPDTDLSRGELAQILYNRAGRPAVTGNSTFTDVAPDAWYSDAISWAAVNGIVSGYGDGRFGPDDSITREQLAVMLWRYADTPAPPNLLLTFPDANTASGYALDALRWAVDQGIISGYSNGQLGPRTSATRAQVAQILRNLFGKQ